MLKSFGELVKIDVTPYCEKRDENLYLNWKKCIDLLRENGAEKVWFEPIQNEKTGSSLYMTDQAFVSESKGVTRTNRCYEVRVKIIIDNDEFIMTSPVSNGGNPVQDNSMTQNRVWASVTRAFVKGVAIRTGLGLSLWGKDEETDFEAVDDLSKHDIAKVYQRVCEKMTAVMQKNNWSSSELAKSMGHTEEEMKAYMGMYSVLGNLEKAVDKL